MTVATQRRSAGNESWAELSGRWFFAWRMAAACEDALREVHLAMARRRSTPERARALEKVSRLLRGELQRWVRRGEALDMIVEHLPSQPE